MSLNAALSKNRQIHHNIIEFRERQLSDLILKNTDFLKSGDIFFLKKPRKIKKCMIEYNHSGIIIDEVANIIDMINIISRNNLLIDYEGEEVIIYRYDEMDDEIFEIGMKSIDKQIGQKISKTRRLFDFLKISRHIHWHRLKKDEVTAKFIHNAVKNDQLFDFESFWGININELHDIVNELEFFKIIYEGKIV